MQKDAKNKQSLDKNSPQLPFTSETYPHFAWLKYKKYN